LSRRTKVRVKEAIQKYAREHKRFSFRQIYESLNKRRVTNVTTGQLGSLLRGAPGVSKVVQPRAFRREKYGFYMGYEESMWEYVGEEE